MRCSGRSAAGESVVVVDSVASPPEVDASLQVDPLLFSEKEGDAVAWYYEEAVPVHRLRDEAATFERLRQTLEGEPAAVLHINAHGVASPYVPSRSVLLLAGGPVSMASLASLPLDGAVVVLSACSSAVGESRGGEGVVGLLWGPMAAGARSVAASHWPVNQEATAALMAEFHAQRSRGFGEAAAMRRARVRVAAAERFEHPHYWAGFGIYGSFADNPSFARSTQEQEWWMPWFAGATLALVALWWIQRMPGRRSGEPSS